MFVARLGGLLAVLFAFRVADRLAGRVAGAIAAVGVLLANGLAYNAARGDSEGILAFLILAAADRHLAGQRRAAFALLAAVGLIRPEVWPLLALYGLWLLRRHPLLVVGSGALVLALWLVPEHAGSGAWLRAATRAQEPASGTPGEAAFPFGAVLLESLGGLAWPLFVGAVAAVVLVPRTRALAAVAGVHVLLVAAMAQGGFTGTLRYLTLPMALLAVLGGVGLVKLWPRLRWRAVVVAVALTGPVSMVALLPNDLDLLDGSRVGYGRDLPALIEAAGGREAIVSCGPIGANYFARMQVAWRLHLRQDEVLTGVTVQRGTVLARSNSGAYEDAPPPVALTLGQWRLRSSC